MCRYINRGRKKVGKKRRKTQTKRRREYRSEDQHTRVQREEGIKKRMKKMKQEGKNLEPMKGEKYMKESGKRGRRSNTKRRIVMKVKREVEKGRVIHKGN